MSKISLSALAVAASLLLGACQQVHTTEGGAIGVNRKQTMFAMLPSEQVDQMAAESYAATLKQAQSKGILNKDSALTNRVRAVAKRLIPQVVVFRKDALAWKWEVNVEDSPELNAYCAPGGKIMFFTGIIEKLKLNDDEIAAIMGHEMAHALREHGRERMSKAYAQQIGAQLLSVVTQGQYDGYIGLASQVTDVAYNLPNSRQNESEADAMGIELAARAGYDPAAAISLWQKMSAAAKGQPPQFLSTHPSNETRISDLQANIPKVLPLYQAARKKG
ncbi:M48 family metallopeptidase [Chitinimonas taiwanensis]|jgi:predicted Zn-dependent protease|uniref:Peptidase family M48 n=1 Tax=Chitinimonas taiwanensis DSM 18899 TaxID=1121279 RepID=A0A1K2H5C4_9NEIS|nr:M48 family metallopeptidase [Chitinimonas taiwanensis]SFZ70362.1 Peptidase family M48 [Chitinimonas taiwanensis DSM 18899]